MQSHFEYGEVLDGKIERWQSTIRILYFTASSFRVVLAAKKSV